MTRPRRSLYFLALCAVIVGSVFGLAVSWIREDDDCARACLDGGALGGRVVEGQCQCLAIAVRQEHDAIEPRGGN